MMDFIKDFIVILVVTFGAVVLLAIVGDLLTGKASNPSDYFKYVDFDGHQYVMYACNNRAGITHSPKCKCLKKKEETDNAQEGR